MALAIGVAGALAAAGCDVKGPGTAARVQKAAVVRVEAIPFFESVGRVHETVGTLAPRERYVVGFEVPGSVLRVLVDDGDVVAEGDALAELDLARFERLVTEAEAVAAQAKLRHDAAVELGGDMPANEREILRHTVVAAEARAAIARDNRDKAICHAPGAGLVETRHIARGSVVGPGVPCFTLIDVDALELTAEVPEAVVPLLTPASSHGDGGTTATVTLDALPSIATEYTDAAGEAGRPLLTKLAWAPNRNHQYDATFSLDNVADEHGALRMRPGMIARVHIALPPLANRYRMPLTASMQDGRAHVFWVADKGSRTTAHRWRVERVTLTGTWLYTAERPPHPFLIVEGFADLTEGAPVRVFDTAD